MKTKTVTMLILTAFLVVALEPALLAQQPTEGPRDGKPPVGSTASVENLAEQVLYQRAFEAVVWSMPAMIKYGMRRGSIEIGAGDNVIMAWSGGATALLETLTPNNTTPYVTSTTDLRKGPVVLEVPVATDKANLFGQVADNWFITIADIGPIGVDKGKGGKILLTPPGYSGKIPAGYIEVKSPSFILDFAFRSIPTPSGSPADAYALSKQLKMYYLSELPNPKPTKFIDPIDKQWSTLCRYDERWFEDLHEIISAGPTRARDKAMMGMLKHIGIEQGKPYRPDAKTKKIFRRAAIDAYFYMQERYLTVDPEELYWPDRRWRDVFFADADMGFSWDQKDVLDYDNRSVHPWFTAIYFPAKVTKRPPTMYLATARDGQGRLMEGGKTYSLTVPKDVPITKFWSLTVYDQETWAFIYTKEKRPGLSSRDMASMTKNADGSVTLYVGPKAPKGLESNWIPTAGKKPYLMFRFYGPKEAFYDKTFKLADVQLHGGGEAAGGKPPRMKMTTDIPASIMTADKVSSSLGDLHYFDGVPTEDTVARVYDYLDRSRAVEAFMNCIPSVSMYAIREGQQAAGADACHKVCIFDQLMDSTSLVLTGNTSTMYAIGFLDLAKDGPTVIDLPPGMLGILDDMAFLFQVNLGVAGPDKGKGGKYLVLPPGYKGKAPEGYFVVPSKTNGVWLFMRGYLDKKLPLDQAIPAASANIRNNLKVYPLARASSPPAMEFINISGKQVNTILPNDYSFFEKVHALIQQEPADFLGAEIKGQLADIGIVKGKPFAPDARMKKILEDAAAIGNAAARAISYSPRDPGQFIYDAKSAWVMGYADKSTTYTKDGVRDLDARVFFHFGYICVSPAMAVTMAGKGSDYAMAAVDSKKRALDGAKTYRLHLPPNPPVKDFWAVTMYDTQTRSQLQTDQQFPTLGSQNEGLVKNPDGSIDIYFAPKPPAGHEKNWLQTVPGKSWFIALRLYGPLQPWIDQTWRPGEIELVN